MEEELILTREEVEILKEHLIERQEGCFFVGDICKVINKINEFLDN